MSDGQEASSITKFPLLLSSVCTPHPSLMVLVAAMGGVDSAA